MTTKSKSSSKSSTVTNLILKAEENLQELDKRVSSLKSQYSNRLKSLDDIYNDTVLKMSSDVDSSKELESRVKEANNLLDGINKLFLKIEKKKEEVIQILQTKNKDEIIKNRDNSKDYIISYLNEIERELIKVTCVISRIKKFIKYENDIINQNHPPCVVS